MHHQSPQPTATPSRPPTAAVPTSPSTTPSSPLQYLPGKAPRGAPKILPHSFWAAQTIAAAIQFNLTRNPPTRLITPTAAARTIQLCYLQYACRCHHSAACTIQAFVRRKQTVLSAEDSVLVGKTIGLLRSLQPNWSDAPFSTIRDRLRAILNSVPRTRHGLARRNAMLQTTLRLTQLYYNQASASAAIKIQCWHRRTTQRLLLAKYAIHVASICRQQAAAQLQALCF